MASSEGSGVPKRLFPLFRFRLRPRPRLRLRFRPRFRLRPRPRFRLRLRIRPRRLPPEARMYALRRSRRSFYRKKIYAIRQFRAGPSSDHSGAQRAGTGTRIWQSVLYSDRPRRSQSRRPALAEDPCEASNSELGSTYTELLTTKSTTPQTSDCDHDRLVRDVSRRDVYSMSPKGVTRSMLQSLGDSIFTTLPDMEQPRPDSFDDSEEFLREVQEYLDAFPHGSLRESFDRLAEIAHATLTDLAAEWGTEPPPRPLVPPREPLPVDQETQSVQAPEQVFAAVAAHARHSVAPTELRPEASREEIIRNGKTWMNEEVMLCFEKHAERSAHLAGLERNYGLDELLHQCFNVESYNKVYHHYNFTVKMKMPNSDDWIVELYFAEVKEMFGRKYYFCCPLEPDENGFCYACKGQGVEDLKHPATGGFSKGSPNAPAFGLWYTDEC